MSSSVCQGFQSRLEPSLVESRFLRLKLAPPITNFAGSIAPPSPCFTNPPPTEPKPMPDCEEKATAITNNKSNSNDYKSVGNQNIDMGGWSFLQSLAEDKESTEHDKVYVHPLAKCSTSMLSERSLKMCTESLGSETGSEVIDSSDDISLLSLETMGCRPSKPRESLMTRKMNRNRSFPPPLTSISSSNGVQVKPHREGGRLVLQAVTIPPCNSYFHAERSKGRLRLSLLKDVSPVFEDEDSEQKDQEEAVEEDEPSEVDNEENVVEGEEGEIQLEGKESPWRAEDMVEGDSGNIGDEIGTGKPPRASSCKESNRGQKRLLPLESFLLAT